jgi:ABC-type glycerol-3-phosphate transport system substrate-binding protein
MKAKITARFGVGLGLALGVAAAMAPGRASAATDINICYMNHPVQVASLAILDKWAKKQGVNLVKTPISYSIYLPKVTQMLTSGASGQCDIIWHNDDWGQDWAQYLVPTDDIPEIGNVAEGQLMPFLNADGKPTTVPMATTAGIMFYRKDLVPDNEVPKTWDELVKISQKLQADGKVKWGYVGGMSFTNTFFSFWWTLWNNNCDIYAPAYERDNAVLAKNGWKPMLTDACQVQTAEFWWDALHKYKISPPGMTTYSRDEANAIFQAGDAAFTVADSTFLGTFEDPKKSKPAGNVGMARFPLGPMSKGQRSWIDIWGWSIPKSSPSERQKAAKALLGAMMTDYEGQIGMWKATGGPPPNTKTWAMLDKDDPIWKQLKSILFDSEHVHDAYYFRNWAVVHKNYSDALIRAMNGSREDIPKTLAEGAPSIQGGANR